MKYLIQLLGLKNLAEDQRLEIFTANLIRNAILIQNAFNVVDSYTSSRKLLGLVKVILLLYNKSRSLVKRGFLIDEKKCDEVLIEVMKISHYVPNENFKQIEELRDKINNESLGLVFNVHRR